MMVLVVVVGAVLYKTFLPSLLRLEAIVEEEMENVCVRAMTCEISLFKLSMSIAVLAHDKFNCLYWAHTTSAPSKISQEKEQGS